MLELQGFEEIKEVREEGSYLIYSGLRKSDHKPVLLKKLRSKHPSADVIALLYHEYDIVKNLELPGIIQCYALIDEQNEYVLVEEDSQGISLKAYLQEKPIRDLSVFLRLAIQMVQMIGEVHQLHIIHKDVKPNSFVIQPNTLKVKITGFRFATRLLHEVQDVAPPEKLEGTLAYISPEQTGRMNMNIDYRTDFYSLGVVLYEMLTGKLPFRYSDPLELIHAHLANPVQDIDESEIQIPLVLQNITKKLMAKNPNDRYQSALGLQTDLERAQKSLESTEKMDIFPLGEFDIFDRLNISQKLYGREKEVKELLAAYDRVSQGSLELLMVCGYSGIGKTMLINEVHKPMVQHRGYFIKGKFDQLTRNTPYSALTQAFNQLARSILAVPEVRFAKMKDDIINALGGVAQVMVDLAPDLSLIIGLQAPLEKLPPIETQNRMVLYLKRFLQTIANQEHPLVMFIDDLQWADSASLKLLSLLLTDEELNHFLLIGAYRENEVDQNHSLKIFMEEIQKKKKMFTSLALQPLSVIDFESLLKDTLHSDDTRIKPLAEIIHTHTGGNPFFANQIIYTYYTDHLIYFDYKNHQWNWDLSAISKSKITDNVVDLMLGKLIKLPEETQILLQYAACLGNHFNVEILSFISGKSVTDVCQLLWPALQQELILPEGNYRQFDVFRHNNLALMLYADIRCRFIHDRVQQAAYQTLSQTEKEKKHLIIARLLMEKKPDIGNNYEVLFEIVDHFNHAKKQLQEVERLEVIKLNYKAALQAKASNAYKAMLHYSTAAISLLNEKEWESNYELAFSTNCEFAWSLFLSNEIAKVIEFTNDLKKRAKNKLDIVKILRIQSKYYHSQGQLDKVFEITRLSFSLLGVHCSKNPGKTSINLKRLSIQWEMRRYHFQNLTNELPTLTNPSTTAIFEILTEVINPLATKGANLIVYLVLLGVEIMLKNGKPKSAAYFTICWALADRLLTNKIERVPQYWALAENLMTEYPDKFSGGLVYMAFAFGLSHFMFPIKASEDFCHRAISDCTESGNRLGAASAKSTLLLNIRAQANSIDDISDAVKNVLKAYADNGIKDSVERFEQSRLLYESFASGNHADEERLKSLQKIIMSQHSPMTKWYVNRELSAYYFYLGMFEQSLFYFQSWSTSKTPTTYDSLLAQDIALHALAIAKSGHDKKRFQEIENELKWISNTAPGNYLHCYLCVKGTKEKLNKNYDKAALYFDQAIENAKKGDFYLWIALANELMVEMLIEQNKPRYAKDYILEARYYYDRFGMRIKVKSLEERYSTYFQELGLYGNANTTTSGTTSVELDFMSVIKASQAISGEIIFNHLLEKILHILVENAGAEKALFIEKNKHEWMVIAKYSRERNEDKFEILNEPLINIENVPQTLIQFSIRSAEPVVLTNAKENNEYKNDVYILKVQPKSILCLPVIYQDKIHGIIYLENNLTIGAFTQNRITVLTTLASQIAISLENARLYYHATHDALTGLANRNLLYQVFELSAGQSRTVSSTYIAIMLFDLDYFKTINDTLGHQVGDKVLIHISNLITACIGKDNLAARLGGDEFVAMIKYRDVQELTNIAEKFLKKLKEPTKFDGHDLTLSSSIGISLYPHHGETIAELLKQADIALYQVKASGKNQFKLFTTPLEKQY